jgi:hypothetical protein
VTPGDGRWLRSDLGGGQSPAPRGVGDCPLDGALGSYVLRDKSIIQFAIDGYPACGTPHEALTYHGLDGENLARRVSSSAGRVETWVLGIRV